ncbi:MAG TPA: VOC family protein [Steroidobacteraceae bacterium]|nr:VOC family protein [Steroidobacteraceae bacterium]
MSNGSASFRLHHVGFVVADIAACVEGFALSLRASWSGEIVTDPLQRVKAAFLTVASDAVLIELVEPTGPDSPVQRFLTERSGGMHHLCYEVSDAEAELSRIRTCKGLIVSRPTPAVAFGGRRIAWALTREKVLLEFLERDLRA